MKCIITTALCLIFALTLLSSCAQPQQPLTAAELLNLGEKYLLELDYEQALVQFLAVIEIEPMNPRGYTGAAEAYVGLGRMKEAQAVLEQGLAAVGSEESIQSLLYELMQDGARLPAESKPQMPANKPTNNPFYIEETGTLVPPTGFQFDEESLDFYWKKEEDTDDRGYGSSIAVLDDVGNIIHVKEGSGSGFNGQEGTYWEYLPFIFSGIWENQNGWEGANGKTPTTGQYSHTLVLYFYEQDSQGYPFNYTSCPIKFTINLTVEAALPIIRAEVYKRSDAFGEDESDDFLYVYGSYDDTSRYVFSYYDDNQKYFAACGKIGSSSQDFITDSTYDRKKFFTLQRFSNFVISGNTISFSMTMPQEVPVGWQITDIDPYTRY
jgi:hypothetical protein